MSYINDNSNLKSSIMTKGHNKGKNNDPAPQDKVTGQDRHLPDSKKDKSHDKGRSSEEDPSGGTKGQNSIS